MPGLDFAAIKLPFALSGRARAEYGDAEHMWVGDVTFDGHTLRGVLLNDAHHIPSLKGGTEVSAPFADLEDWMYVCTNVLCGGFTVQALRSDMLDVQRKEHDEAWGQPFPDPDLCNITPYDEPPQQERSRWSKLWTKPSVEPFGRPFEEAMRLADAQEHPMSENTRESILRELQANPEMATAVDDDGWTLLHRDALSGNLAPVQALMAMGADPHLRTPQGDTAVDLAKRMRWPRVVKALTQPG